jgi:hypothetical protein
MNNKPLETLKEEYYNIPIPNELDSIVRKAIKGKGQCRPTKVWWFAGVAVVVIMLVGGINISPAMASMLSGVPVIKDLVHVLTFRDYQVDEGTYQANIEVPVIEGLEDKTLEEALNTKYLEENKILYDKFMADMKGMKEQGGGHLGVDSGYVVKTDTDRILAIGRYVVNTVGSSSTKFQYDTIDKKDQVLITLPSLFKDEDYIEVISENIKTQMREQMQANSNKVYWVSGTKASLPFEGFNKITKNQAFYLNSENKLVISFDKYEVAPGYMGVVEFVIPTDVIAHQLVSHEYIK